jgi:hypothetical protein
MPRRLHVVTLSSDERAALQQRIGTGTAPARELTRCRILLKVDTAQRGPRLTDGQVATALEVSARTVARVRADFTDGGIARATHRQPPNRVYPRRLDGAAEAKLVELACGPAPDGHRTWSLRLLSEALVRLELVPHVAPNTVRAVLKKTRLSPGRCAVGA